MAAGVGTSGFSIPAPPPPTLDEQLTAVREELYRAIEPIAMSTAEAVLVLIRIGAISTAQARRTFGF